MCEWAYVKKINMATDFKKIKVWMLSRALVKDIYLFTEKFPEREKYGMISQMQRAVVSVPSNIARFRDKVFENTLTP